MKTDKGGLFRYNVNECSHSGDERQLPTVKNQATRNKAKQRIILRKLQNSKKNS